jgi:hypothetical protein
MCELQFFDLYLINIANGEERLWLLVTFQCLNNLEANILGFEWRLVNVLIPFNMDQVILKLSRTTNLCYTILYYYIN